ncbi:hypothetical protein GCM10007872_08260 [Gluconobacter sphaericus NBRC 12467]|uniref:Uncharacterized protein n=1 Tax=Gluconobacter sphaericus NBRC 12467 TaxID=1307951 RepID=A0AA37WAQ3_9PROT|nr:hypothetical protein [Gluconobacter sphaericus]GEB43736.1 hypothetical protein GSP01_25180 [Gluconobacter sphaericus NBRC 12467]GLQ83918.1 hypothetical protein GCM10007872_08260 [Gluconobacter sphaericus NBRC 12467]
MLKCVSTSHGIPKMGHMSELVQVIANSGQFALQATDLGTNVAA